MSSVGGTALTISMVSTSGVHPGNFSETNNCSSQTLNPKATCSIIVTFKPQAKGSRSATLVVTDTASNWQQLIPLSGTGD